VSDNDSDIFLFIFVIVIISDLSVHYLRQGGDYAMRSVCHSFIYSACLSFCFCGGLLQK